MMTHPVPCHECGELTELSEIHERKIKMMLNTISADSMWQTTPLDYAIAAEFFGWRWLSFHCRPTRSHPDYPQKMRVRRFYPPDSELGKQWQEYFAEEPHEPAKGDEPLSYCYCSSNGPHCIPHFSGHAEAIAKLESELKKRNVFKRYYEILAVFIDSSESADLATAEPEAKCIAAMATIRSKQNSVLATRTTIQPCPVCWPEDSPTRGDVRLLCRALGIPLKEQPQCPAS